jgi:hypothetical protein
MLTLGMSNNGAAGQMPSSSGGCQQDIRQWMSSPGTPISFSTPKRRRRVMTTSDSEEERGQHSRQAQTPQTLPRPASQESATAAIARDGNVIMLETSSDDMREAAAGGAERQQLITGHHQMQQRRAAGHNVPMSRAANINHTPRARMPQRRRSMPEAEASESSAESDSDSSCVETDTNARSQYRDAIMGVRNAQRARQQMRARTQSCPTCALFASFLRAFT